MPVKLEMYDIATVDSVKKSKSKDSEHGFPQCAEFWAEPRKWAKPRNLGFPRKLSNF